MLFRVTIKLFSNKLAKNMQWRGVINERENYIRLFNHQTWLILLTTIAFLDGEGDVVLGKGGQCFYVMK